MISFRLSERFVARNEKVFFRGYMIYKSRYIDSKNIGDFSSEILLTLDSGDLDYSEIAGNYTLIACVDNCVYILSDVIRTYPVFLGLVAHKLYISDSINDIPNKVKVKNLSYEKELLCTGYLTGDKTLYENVYQSECASLIKVCLLSYRVEKKSLYQFVYKSDVSPPSIENLHNVHLDIFRSAISFLNGRQVVIPLSGGYDSRLVAQMFYELGYNNVVCFTYGKKDCWEVDISKSIAEEFGFNWFFIEYNKKKWDEFAKERSDFFEGLFNGASIPHIQDYIAVQELHSGGLISKNSVFVPGHAADFLEGTHIPSSIFLNDSVSYLVNDVKSTILSKHYILWPSKKEDFNIFGEYDPDKCLSKVDAINLFETWVWKERQCKFIANSIRNYEYFGYECILPLWDIRLVDYWLTQGLEDRFGRKKYLEYVKKYSKSDIDANPSSKTIISAKTFFQQSGVYDKILMFYLNIMKLFYYRNDRMGFFMQYKKTTVYYRFLQGANNINSFVSKDLLKYIKSGTHNAKS